MTIGILQKAIDKKAEDRFQEDFRKTIQLIEQSEILKRLKINTKIPDVLQKPFFGNAYGMFYPNAHYLIKSFLCTHTNFNDVKQAIIDDYIEQETSALLDKVENIKDFLQEIT